MLFEAAQHPLRKVRISGGGRCNVTHYCFDPAELANNYPRGGKELVGPFTRFGPRETVAWFEREGVRLKVEEDGRMFPVSDQSATVVDCLVQAVRASGIQLRLGTKVKHIEAVGRAAGSPQFEIARREGVNERYDRVLLATGGSPAGYRFAATLGHSIVPCVPSLFTFNVADPRLEGLAGMSFEKVRLTLTDGDKNRLEATGPLLITHWRFSGPAVLKLSAWGAQMLRHCNYCAELTVNLLPDYSALELYRELVAFKGQNGRKRVQSE